MVRTRQLGDVGCAQPVRIVAAAAQHLTDLALPEEDLRAQAVKAFAQPMETEEKPMEMAAPLLLGEPCQQGFQSLLGKKQRALMVLLSSSTAWLHHAISAHTGTKSESQKGS